MRVLGVASLGDVLADWGVHEARGRFVEEGTIPPGFLDQFGGQDRRLQAIGVILQRRLEVVATIFAATPTACFCVEVTRADLPSIFAMGAKPLTEYSREKLAEAGNWGDWVRSAAAGPENISGPVVAVARRPDGPITLFDGNHRMAAWVAHLNEGREYPMAAYVVVTADVAPFYELPP